MNDDYALNSPEQLHALGHPTRHRILNLLIERAATNQQIATALGESPARIHFHVRQLLTAGLITMVEERPKGGVLEKYYRAVARSFRLGSAFQVGGASEEPASEVLGLSLLASAEQELRATLAEFSGRPLYPFVGAHFQGRLSPAQLDRVQQLVARIGQEFDGYSREGQGQQFTLTIVAHPQTTSVSKGVDHAKLVD